MHADRLYADDFFVGIGDINSTFLPKVQPLAPTAPELPPPPTVASPDGPESSLLVADADDDDESDLEDESFDSESPSSPAPEPEDELAEIEKDDLLSRNVLALEEQFEERPLAKKQEELQETETAGDTTPDAGEAVAGAEPEANGTSSPAPEQKKEKPVRKALLKNDDTELIRVKQVRQITPANLTICQRLP